MLSRLSNTILEVTVDTTAAASEEINFSGYAGGVVFIPTTAGASITTLTWYAAEKSGGTYLPLSDEDGVAVAQTVSHTKVYALPSALYGCRFLKAVGNAAGTIIISVKG
jgi:hypothetical protein